MCHKSSKGGDARDALLIIVLKMSPELKSCLGINDDKVFKVRLSLDPEIGEPLFHFVKESQILYYIIHLCMWRHDKLGKT